MVAVTPELLIPLHVFITVFFIVVFAILKEYSIENRNWFTFGMFFGAFIYAMLVFGSTFKESKMLSEFALKYIALGFGGTYYVTTVLFSIIISFMIFEKKVPKWIHTFFKGKEKRAIYILAGMTLIFAICEVYFALRCPETIPFFENLVSTNSTCSKPSH